MNKVNKELMLKLVEEKLDELMTEVDELMQLQKELRAEQPEFIVPSQDYSFNLEDTLESVNEDMHSKYYYDIGRNRTYEEMIAAGYTMTDDGFWMKDKDNTPIGCVTFS